MSLIKNPDKEKAIELLIHYFGLVGLDTTSLSDSRLELEELIDCIINATIRELQDAD